MGKFLVPANQAFLHLGDRKAKDLLKKERYIVFLLICKCVKERPETSS